MIQNIVPFISENDQGQLEYRFRLNGVRYHYFDKEQMTRDIEKMGWGKILEKVVDIGSKEFKGYLCFMRYEYNALYHIKTC